MTVAFSAGDAAYWALAIFLVVLGVAGGKRNRHRAGSYPVAPPTTHRRRPSVGPCGVDQPGPTARITPAPTTASPSYSTAT